MISSRCKTSDVGTLLISLLFSRELSNHILGARGFLREEPRSGEKKRIEREQVENLWLPAAVDWSYRANRFELGSRSASWWEEPISVDRCVVIGCGERKPLVAGDSFSVSLLLSLRGERNLSRVEWRHPSKPSLFFRPRWERNILCGWPKFNKLAVSYKWFILWTSSFNRNNKLLWKEAGVTFNELPILSRF